MIFVHTRLHDHIFTLVVLSDTTENPLPEPYAKPYLFFEEKNKTGKLKRENKFVKPLSNIPIVELLPPRRSGWSGRHRQNWTLDIEHKQNR